MERAFSDHVWIYLCDKKFLSNDEEPVDMEIVSDKALKYIRTEIEQI